MKCRHIFIQSESWDIFSKWKWRRRCTTCNAYYAYLSIEIGRGCNCLKENECFTESFFSIFFADIDINWGRRQENGVACIFLPDAASVLSVFDFHRCRRDSVACISSQIVFPFLLFSVCGIQSLLGNQHCPGVASSCIRNLIWGCSAVNTIHYLIVIPFSE